MKLDKYLECFEELDDCLIDDAAPAFKERKHISKKIILSAALVVVISVMTLLTAYKLGDNHTLPEIPLQSTATESSEELYVQSVTGSEAELSTENVMSPLEDRVDYTSETVSDSVAEDVVDGLPTLTPELSVSGYGFEGMLVYDISELDKNDPFDPEKKLDTLPVYKNLSYDIRTTQLGIFHLSKDDMKALGESCAKRLGYEIISFEYDYLGMANEYVISCTVICNDVKIKVNSKGGISYIFEGDAKIFVPNGIIKSKEKVTPEEKQRIVDYLVNNYSEYLPCGKLIGGGAIDYPYSGEYNHYQNYRIADYYEAVPNDYEQSILNYSFRSYSFRLSEDLTHIEKITIPGDYTAYTEKLGDYPVITYKDALDRLCEGKYLSTVSEKYLTNGIITEDIVHHTEIVYLTAPGNKVFMPYYKYYVLLGLKHEKSPEDLKNYGVFYVPAVSSEYIKADSVVVNGQWGMSNENT